MAKEGGHSYLVELIFGNPNAGGSDFAKAIEVFEIETLFHSPISILHFELNITRKQYDTFILPNRDKCLFRLQIAANEEHEANVKSPKDILEEELLIIEENDIDNPLSIAKNKEKREALCRYVFKAITKKNNKQQQKFLKNLVFYKKNRKQILEKILEGTDYYLFSDAYEDTSEVEQFWIPPMTQYQALHYVQYWLGIIKHGKPFVCNYGVDGKLYIGSAAKNKLAPYKIFYGTEPEDEHLIKQIISYNNKEYDSILLNPLKTEKTPIIETSNTSTNFKYLYKPMNRLDHIYDKNIEEYKTKNEIIDINIYGTQKQLLKQIRNNNSEGQNWSNVHTGVYFINREDTTKKELNENFSNQYVSEMMNDLFKIELQLSWGILPKDFRILGRHVELITRKRKIGSSGKYYMRNVNLTFSRVDKSFDSYVFLCEANFEIRGGIQTEKI